jgi:glycosyltransferase involved in cell wall biosynthesis
MNVPAKYNTDRKVSILSALIPFLAFILAFLSRSLLLLDYVHVLIGAVWIGIDVFLGLLFSSVVRTIDQQSKIDIGRRMIPMILFFIPSASIVTPIAGYVLSVWEGIFSLTSHLFIAIIALGFVIVVISFFLILPSSLGLLREVSKNTSDSYIISRQLLLISKWAFLQLIFQIAIVSLMAYIVVYL